MYICKQSVRNEICMYVDIYNEYGRGAMSEFLNIFFIFYNLYINPGKHTE